MSVLARFHTVVVLTVFDAAATLHAVGVLGAVELNPLLGRLIGTVGLETAMTLRAIFGVAGAGALAVLAEHPRNRMGAGPLTVAGVVLGLVAVWHVGQYVAFYL